MKANEFNAETGCQFSARRRDVRMNAEYLHKWWSTLKSGVLARLHFFLLSLVHLVDWSVSRLVKQIFLSG